MLNLGASLASKLKPGDVVLLTGPLGAGKTTLVRGYLAELGVTQEVRSPTFNLLQVFDTDPPVLHADLYRLTSPEGTGIEDYLDSHVCFIEWAERAEGLVSPEAAWHINIEFAPEGRSVCMREPSQRARY